METKRGMRNIWFFVGLILTAIGFLVLAAGIYDLMSPSAQEIRLAHLHANIWWGVIILAAGVLYVVKNKDGYVE
jgi:hypothetical protein